VEGREKKNNGFCHFLIGLPGLDACAVSVSAMGGLAVPEGIGEAG